MPSQPEPYEAGHVVLRVAEQIGGGLETGGLLWTGGRPARSVQPVVVA